MPATYEPIATTTVSGTSTTLITFGSLPSSYTDLRVIMSGLANTRTLWLRFNGDTGTNYSYTRVAGTGAAVVVGSDINFNNITVGSVWDMSTTIPTFFDINVFSYAGSTNKTIFAITSADKNGSGGNEVTAGLWRNTSAITSINLQCGNGATAFTAGTTATVYGILRA
jgi:hypothetical protein